MIAIDKIEKEEREKEKEKRLNLWQSYEKDATFGK